MPFPKLGPHRLCVPCVQTCDHGSPSSQEVPTEAVVECGEEASQREMACKAELRKEKMSSLLQAVRRKGEKQPRPQQPTPPIPPSNPQQQLSSSDLSLITSKIVSTRIGQLCGLFLPMSVT